MSKEVWCKTKIGQVLHHITLVTGVNVSLSKVWYMEQSNPENLTKTFHNYTTQIFLLKYNDGYARHHKPQQSSSQCSLKLLVSFILAKKLQHHCFYTSTALRRKTSVPLCPALYQFWDWQWWSARPLCSRWCGSGGYAGRGCTWDAGLSRHCLAQGHLSQSPSQPQR